MTSLELTLLYLAAAVIGVVACRSLKLPPMLGYLGAGVLIGPHALSLARDADGIRHLGEFGVVFLMFVIGLEFSLPKLRAMRQHVFGLGLLQVMLTMAIATAGALLVATQLPAAWRLGWQTALVLSGALTMSSTASVMTPMRPFVSPRKRWSALGRRRVATGASTSSAASAADPAAI